MLRTLTLVTVGGLLVGLFPVGASVGPFTPGSVPLAPSSPTTATPPPATAHHPPHADAGSDCTLRHAAATDITGVQPHITVNASIGSLDTGASYDETVVRYRVTFSRPDAVTNLSVKPYGGEVIEMDGFTPAGALFAAANETMSMTVQVRPRRARFGWAFVRPPTIAYQWTSGDDRQCTYTMDAQTPLTVRAGPGLNASYAQQGVLLSPGRHVDRTFTADGTTVRIVYDATRSGSQFAPARVEAELTRVVRHFDVGAATERVTIFALPASASGPATAYSRGPDPSSRTVTVGTARRIGDEGGVWIHEYVHAVQTFTVGEQMRWFVEGSAEYYAHLLRYQLTTRPEPSMTRGRARKLIRTVQHARESVLTDPDTWEGNTQYHQGAAAVLVLDDRLREASNGTYTMVDVFRWMNTYEGTVTYDAFRRRLVLWGNESVGRWLDTHVAGRTAYSATGVTMPATGPVTHAEHANRTEWRHDTMTRTSGSS